MKRFEVWSEGFAATGESGRALFHGETTAESFQAACEKVFQCNPTFNAKTLTYWGCRLFDNEADARRSFG